MKLSREQLELINSTHEFILKWCPEFDEDDCETEWTYSDERINEIIEEEEDIDHIPYSFPGEYEVTCVDIEEFLDLADEIPSIKIIHNGLIQTSHKSLYIVSTFNSDKDHLFRDFFTDTKVETEEYIISLIEESFVVGLAATHLEIFNSDYLGTISPYIVLQIHYKNDRFSKSEEEKLLNSFLFEVADSFGITLGFSEISNPTEEYYTLRDEAEETASTELRELEENNEGMKYFTSAVQINDPELKFLNFYKVLEHFSPIAVNIEANELMRKKLDAPKSSFEDGDFIRSIFDLANSMRDRYRDEDLIKASFNSCLDVIGLFETLPGSLKQKVKSHLKKPEINYSLEKQQVTTMNNMIAKIIYKTRNKVVHAKSNFTLTGDEIQSDEMDQLNIFMKQACSQAIRWYNRQPKHLQLNII